MTQELLDLYDVVVIGGGAAGLSGAVALGRARRSVLVIDAGEPRNAPVDGIHNFLTRDGIAPADFLAAGRTEAATYGAHFVAGKAVSARRDDTDFTVTLHDGSTVRGRRLLVTTGLIDEIPAVDGLRERWGHDVLHCPYCHGWEVRDTAIGILGTSPMAAHQALLFRQWSSDITLFLNDIVMPTDDEWEKLAARGITVIDGTVASLEVTSDALTGVVMTDGRTHPVAALTVAPRFVARGDVLVSLGLEAVEHPMGVGSYIESGPMGVTAVPGVWLAGNVTDLMAQVVTSAGAGLMAASAINMDLMTEETTAAVEVYRARAGNHGHQAGGHTEGHTQPGRMHTEHGEPTEVWDEAFWNNRYGSTAIWSGNPNPQLVTEATDLTPGTALEIGAGEGADAMWLAQRGWNVTAVDLSTVALTRAAATAVARDPEAAARITWEHHDLLAWQPPKAQFDLVTTHFMHLEQSQREILFAQLADAVAAGGTLLIVGHHPMDWDSGLHRHGIRNFLYSETEIAGALDPKDWVIETSDARERTTTVEGSTITIHDAIVRARRR